MEEKLTFWKKLKTSITDFEGYQKLATEKIGKTILYIIILMLIFSVIVTGLYIYKFANMIEYVRKYITYNIETITFENNTLKIIPNNHEEELKIEYIDDLNIQVIINTNLNKEDKEQKLEEIKSMENGILVLEDRILIQNELISQPQEYLYKDLAEQFGIGNIDKDDILEYLSINNILPALLTSSTIICIYMLIMYLSTVLIDILLFSAMGYIFTIIAKVRIKYSAVYNIASYAMTLPIILNLVYFIVNFFTGFTIKYFDIMYTAVISIYIVTAILMIKSEMIKRQLELAKIIQEQEKIRAELQQKREEEKEKEKEKQEEKKEKQKDKDEENQEDQNNDGQEKKPKNKKHGKPDINIGNEPEKNGI